jgi:serine/threonine protein kinase HipA of HipAB toxin-antitoxin module
MSRLAAGCGLPSAEVSMLKLDCGPALQIRRFDRQRRPRGNSIHRLHVISGWQLLGLPPQPINAPVEVRQAWLTALLRAVRAHAADPRAEVAELLRRVAWQVLAGIHNMEPGNLAFFVDPGGRLRLAPSYGLRSLWPFERADGFSPRPLALPVGGQADPEKVDAAAWAWLAEEADTPADELLDGVRRLGRQLLARLPTASRQSRAEGADGGVVERLAEGVRGLCQTVIERARDGT